MKPLKILLLQKLWHSLIFLCAARSSRLKKSVNLVSAERRLFKIAALIYTCRTPCNDLNFNPAVLPFFPPLFWGKKNTRRSALCERFSRTWTHLIEKVGTLAVLYFSLQLLIHSPKKKKNNSFLLFNFFIFKFFPNTNLRQRAEPSPPCDDRVLCREPTPATAEPVVSPQHSRPRHVCVCPPSLPPSPAPRRLITEFASRGHRLEMSNPVGPEQQVNLRLRCFILWLSRTCMCVY